MKRTLLIILTIVAIWFLLVSFSNRTAEPVVYEEYTICPGDTIWDIATDYSNGADIRKVVYEIREANGIDDGVVKVGDIILVPVR